MPTERTISRHSNEGQALHALRSYVETYEDMGTEYAREIGHAGARMEKTFPGGNTIERWDDSLGSGEFYEVRKTAEGFTLLGSW